MMGVLALGVGVLGSGCSGFQAPELEHIGATLVEQSADASVYRVTVRATNPNEKPMPLREVNYRLAFATGTVVSGGRSPQATVPGYGILDVSFPAVYPGQAPPAGTPYTLSGELVYVSPGEFADVLFDAGVSRPTASLRGEGTVQNPGG